jgi:hypothetical protein
MRDPYWNRIGILTVNIYWISVCLKWQDFNSNAGLLPLLVFVQISRYLTALRNRYTQLLLLLSDIALYIQPTSRPPPYCDCSLRHGNILIFRIIASFELWATLTLSTAIAGGSAPSSPARVSVCKSRAQWGAVAGRTVHLRWVFQYRHSSHQSGGAAAALTF